MRNGSPAKRATSARQIKVPAKLRDGEDYDDEITIDSDDDSEQQDAEDLLAPTTGAPLRRPVVKDRKSRQPKSPQQAVPSPPRQSSRQRQPSGSSRVAEPDPAPSSSPSVAIIGGVLFAAVAVVVICFAFAGPSSPSRASSQAASGAQALPGCGIFNLTLLAQSYDLKMPQNGGCFETVQNAISSHGMRRALNLHLLSPSEKHNKMARFWDDAGKMLHLPSWAVVHLHGNEKRSTIEEKLFSFAEKVRQSRSGDLDSDFCFEGIIAIDAANGLALDARAVLEQPMDDSAPILPLPNNDRLSTKKMLIVIYQREDSQEALEVLSSVDAKLKVRLATREEWTHRFYQRIVATCSVY